MEREVKRVTASGRARTVRIEKSCEVCGKIFLHPLSHEDRRHTCSRKCAGIRRRHREASKCPVCGKLIVRPAWIAKDRLTCSVECNAKRRQHRARKRCVVCGKEFEVPWCRRKKAKYCSRSCLQSTKRRVRNPPNKAQLEHLIQMLTLRQIAKQYGVTDNAVRYWCKVLGVHIPSRSERAALKKARAESKPRMTSVLD